MSEGPSCPTLSAALAPLKHRPRRVRLEWLHEKDLCMLTTPWLRDGLIPGVFLQLVKHGKAIAGRLVGKGLLVKKWPQ